MTAAHSVRYFRRAILETLRVMTDSISGSDTAHTASTTGSMSSFNAVHTAIGTLAVVRILYVNTA